MPASSKRSPSAKPSPSETASTESAPEATPNSVARTRFQTGQVQRLNRSQIQLAAYNPRTANREAARRLRDNIEKVGLLGPALVLNQRTGNLISGHLRLAQLDVLEEGNDYAVDVTVVDWPQRREKQQNVFLNNPWAQGEFDLESLGQMLAEDLKGLDDFGLDVVEVQHLFPDDERFGDLFSDPEPENTNQPGAKAAFDEIEADKDAERQERAEERAEKKKRTPEETVQHRQEYAAIMDEANSADFYVVVVCKDAAQCTKVLEAMGTGSTDSRYVSAEVVLRALGQ